MQEGTTKLKHYSKCLLMGKRSNLEDLFVCIWLFSVAFLLAICFKHSGFSCWQHCIHPTSHAATTRFPSFSDQFSTTNQVLVRQICVVRSQQALQHKHSIGGLSSGLQSVCKNSKYPSPVPTLSHISIGILPVISFK